MRKFLCIKKWFVRLFSPDKKTLGAIGEDLRKVAVTAIGVGIAGLAVSGDTIIFKEGGLVLVIGIILWVYGIILTKVSNS
ncbi:permease [Xenorhabdus sp. TS4]|uniref:permease n=1 Tax=Xenorhabdus sp. TS4 TaxID=1873483 RepID=UPI0016570369|nr:permease [Xenorhabdus sp. TS4]MBC8951057.1 permease [Xenorhabdus sp. TS4]